MPQRPRDTEVSKIDSVKNVKDTGFLSWNYDDPDKDDDQWLYLPALKKVQRISSSKKADYFMGTDFTYSDMGDLEVDDYTYTHLEPEVIDGVECYHLERVPKDKQVLKETGYGRTEMWIRPDNWILVKAKFYDKNLKFLKEFAASDFARVAIRIADDSISGCCPDVGSGPIHQPGAEVPTSHRHSFGEYCRGV